MKSRLIIAIKHNNLPMLEHLLSDDFRNYSLLSGGREHRGKSALHWAAKLGRLEMLQFLIEKALRADISLDIEDSQGKTALFYAITASTRAVEMVELLMNHDARIDHRDHDNKTILRVAAEMGRTEIATRLAKVDKATFLEVIKDCTRRDGANSAVVETAKTLIKCGVDVRAKSSSKGTPNALHLAAWNGCLATVHLLAEYDDLVQERDQYGKTALHKAAKMGWQDVVEYLLVHCNAELEAADARNRTPLHVAARMGHIDTVRYLLKSGANFMAETFSGCTPVFHACFNGQDEVAVVLLQEMTQLQALSITNGYKVSLIQAAAGQGCIEMVKRLVDYTKNTADGHDLLLNMSPVDGYGATYDAIRGNHHDIAMLLLENGASIQGFDHNKYTSLHWAAHHGDVELISYLLEHREEVDELVKLKNNDGETPIDLAAKNLHGDTVACLLKHDDSQLISEDDTRGWKSLHWAARYGRLDLVRIMVTHGADVSELDTNEHTAADIARGLRPESIELLEWLTLPESYRMDTPEYKPITSPVMAGTAEIICKNIQVCIMDFYNNLAIEKSGFSAYNILYEYRPQAIMSAAAKARRVVEPLKTRWIHLPANSKTWLKDLTQAIYYDRANSRVTDTENGSSYLSRTGSNDDITDNQSTESESVDSEVNLQEENQAKGDSRAASDAEKNSVHINEGPEGDRVGNVIGHSDGGKDEIKRNDPDMEAPKKVDLRRQTSRRNVRFEARKKSQEEIGTTRSSIDNTNDARHETDRDEIEGTYSQMASHRGQNTTQEAENTNESPQMDAMQDEHEVRRYFEVRNFVEECLAFDIGPYQNQLVQPFFKHFLNGDDHIGLSMPYISFTKIKYQAELQQSFYNIPNQSPEQFLENTSDTRDSATARDTSIQKMIEHYGQLNIQVPQTLDQFYYHSLAGTDGRTTDQVLFRHQAHVPGNDRVICIVDQLWLYVVDNETIITSCSQQRGEDAINIQKIISEHFTRDSDRQLEVSRVYGMIPLVMALCARKSIEWEIGESRERLLEIFGSAIARAAHREAELFHKFTQGLKPENQLLREDKMKLPHYIYEEIELLKEVKDILDELNIIRTVLTSQRSILKETFTFLRSNYDSSLIQRKDSDNITIDTLSDITDDTIDYYWALSKIDSSQQEVDKLAYDAKEVQKNINHLLDLRQKDANLSEAIWARKSSEDTTRQGRTIMVFTVVTIIFLPITFLTSLFALDITSFPHGDDGDLSYSPEWAFSRLFGIMVAVSLPLILIAFFINEVSDFLSGFLKGEQYPDKATIEGADQKKEGPVESKKDNGHAVMSDRAARRRSNGWLGVFRRRPSPRENDGVV
ncbi:ankyrin repeat-containing domain protein [Biscogniauxia sp. FL1348]|nr:ankyrin repeat-containing domain protein [Biscogniauxia sp. FL1348]